jgi:hypothetical protein
MDKMISYYVDFSNFIFTQLVSLFSIKYHEAYATPMAKPVAITEATIDEKFSLSVGIISRANAVITKVCVK